MWVTVDNICLYLYSIKIHADTLPQQFGRHRESGKNHFFQTTTDYCTGRCRYGIDATACYFATEATHTAMSLGGRTTLMGPCAHVCRSLAWIFVSNSYGGGGGERGSPSSASAKANALNTKLTPLSPTSILIGKHAVGVRIRIRCNR